MFKSIRENFLMEKPFSKRTFVPKFHFRLKIVRYILREAHHVLKVHSGRTIIHYIPKDRIIPIPFSTPSTNSLYEFSEF